MTRSVSKQLPLKVAAFLLVALVPLNSCSTGSLSAGKDTAKLPLKELEVSDYFARDSGVEERDRVSFVSALKELQERPLKEVGTKGKAYRFIALPSFYKPLCVTAYFPDEGESFIVGKQILLEPRAGTSEPFRRDRLKAPRIRLSDEKAASLKRVFEQVNYFWLDQYDQYTRPPLFEFDFNGRHFSSPCGEIMKDGTAWVMEGWDHGSYRVLQRQSPGDEDSVRKLAILLMTECKFLPEKIREIY